MKKILPFIVGVLIMVAGIVVGMKGVVKIRASQSMNVPAMGEEGWFEMSSQQSSMLVSGIVITILGFVFLGFLGLAVCLGALLSKKNGQSTTTDESAKESETNPIAELFSNIKNYSGENAENKETTCKYCGGVIPDGKTNCPSCGARVNKKK